MSSLNSPSLISPNHKSSHPTTNHLTPLTVTNGDEDVGAYPTTTANKDASAKQTKTKMHLTRHHSKQSHLTHKF